MLRVRSANAYLSGGPHEWRQPDWDAKKAIDAIKGEPINGYANLLGVDGKKRKLNEANRNLAWEHYALWAVAHVKALKAPIALLPIPSSKCIDATKAFTAKRLAAEIAQRSAPGMVIVTPTLQFRREMPSSRSEGGSRDPDVLEQSMVWNTQAAQPTKRHTIVLVDDVTTSGGHLRAAARLVRARGFACSEALCAAKTKWEQVKDPFAMIEEMLPD